MPQPGHVVEFCHHVSKDGYICVGYKDHRAPFHWDQHHHHEWVENA